MLTKDRFPMEIIEVCQLLNHHGFQAFIVGGSIRDIIQGNPDPQDWDITTDAKPSEVMKIFTKDFRVIPTGIKHGTISVLSNKLSIEITTFRIEGDYIDGRRPSEVTFVTDIKEDLARRDLTINAIAFDPIHEELIDPFKGLDDIYVKTIRMVGNPNDRLQEDGLRLIRIFRFVAQLGFDINSQTFAAVPNHFEIFSKVAKERIHTEFQKLMIGTFFQKAVSLLGESGLLSQLIPEFLHEEYTQELPKIELSRLDLTLGIISALPAESSLRLRFTALFHQLTALPTKSTAVFPPFKEKTIQAILKRMKFTNKQITEISHLLKIHHFRLPYSTETQEEKKDYSIRKFQFHIRPEFLTDYLEFYRAKEQVLQKKERLSDELKLDILKRAKNHPPIDLKDLVLNGDDIIQFFQLDKKLASQREFIGLCLKIIRERVEVKPQTNQKRELLEILEHLNRVISQCTAQVTRYARIVSTDHIRKLYRNGKPEYLNWENEHTYQLTFWLILCLLRKDKSSIVIFDGTNFNMPGHPNHREFLGKKFRKYLPLYIHSNATENEVRLNLQAREQEKPSIKKSDADLTIFKRYQELLKTYPRALSTPEWCEMIHISTHSQNYLAEIRALANKINQNGHRLIIMSGNVLSGKTHTAYTLQEQLEKAKGL